jgi:hypothetical protein
VPSSCSGCSGCRSPGGQPPPPPPAIPPSRRRYRAARPGLGLQAEELERLLLLLVDYPLNLQLNGARRPIRLPGARALHDWPVVVPELAASAPGVATRAGSLRQAWQKVMAG